MAPLLRSLLGNGSKDREAAEEMRAMLQEMQQERVKYESLLASVRASSEHLQTLGEPIAKAEGDVTSVASRIGELEQRFAAMVQLVPKFESMHDRAEGLVEGQHRAESQVVQALEEANRIRTSFDEIGSKIEQALSLRERLENFLEVEKPFQQVRDDVGALRGQVEGTGDHLTRLREQHDRLLDAHKMATTKQEALDRRREELSRDLQDKERRVASVAAAVRGLDGVQQTVDEIRRQMGTLKALGDFVAQKGAALEAQKEAVESALARAESLDRAMRQIDAGVRQQQENEASLNSLHDHVTSLQALHETVVDRSREISQLQRDTDEQIRTTRVDLAVVQDEVKKAVERFDFESHGLESVSQRVTDVRGSLSDFENRFKGVSEASHTVAQLVGQTQGLSERLQSLSSEVQQIEEESTKLQSIRRDLDVLGQAARETGAKVARIEDARPAVEAALNDFEQLRGAHALVKDSLEQNQLVHAELNKARETNAGTRQWLSSVEGSVEALKARVEELSSMEPLVDLAHQQTQQIGQAMSAIETRREFVDEVQGRLTNLGTLSANLDERGRQLLQRMETAEDRFTGLSSQAEEAERTRKTIAETASSLAAAEKDAAEVRKLVADVQSRCESVESLADKTRVLKKELDQRQQALEAAKKDLQQASGLRQTAAASAQQLEELSESLTAALSVAEARVVQIQDVSTRLEHRAADLQPVEKRLDQFESRLAKWSGVEQDVARSLEQIAARQGTVGALQGDLDRMFAMAEKTASEVREITSAQREIEESRKLLDSVMGRIAEIREMGSALDERKRQISKAEERLARSEALLMDVRGSLEALQGQKVIVDQAVEKAGSLKFMIRQAEGMLESMREERDMAGRVRDAIGVKDEDDDEDEDGVKGKRAA